MRSSIMQIRFEIEPKGISYHSARKCRTRQKLKKKSEQKGTSHEC